MEFKFLNDREAFEAKVSSKSAWNYQRYWVWPEEYKENSLKLWLLGNLWIDLLIFKALLWNYFGNISTLFPILNNLRDLLIIKPHDSEIICMMKQ